MKLLAIDIGASGGKAMLGDFSEKSLKITELRRFQNGMVSVNGIRHWPVLRLHEDIKACLAAAGSDVAAAGVDTWGVDYGYIGRDGDLLGLPFAYRQPRTDRAIARIHERLPPPKLYAKNGLQFLPFNTIYQVADDMASRPWLVENADKLLLMPALLGYLLTGRAVSEYTMASTTGLLDAVQRKWSPDLLAAAGFPADRLPTVIEAGSVRTPLLADVARETNSRAEFIFPAGHDTAAAVAAVPAQGDDWAFLSAGTWFLVGTELSAPMLSEAARTAGFTNEGGVGGRIRFLKNVTGLWLLEELRRQWRSAGRDIGFAEIVAEARRAPAFAALVNPDDPTLAAPDDMTAAIAALCRTSGQRPPEGVGPLARCVFESLALASQRVLDRLQKVSGRNVRRLHVVGGASRNEMLCEMLAAACNVTVLAGPEEATATGSLLVQAMGMGVISGLDEGRELVRRSIHPREYQPATARSAWDAATARFEKLLG